MKNWEKNMHIFMMCINILPTFCRIKIKTVDNITAQNTHFFFIKKKKKKNDYNQQYVIQRKSINYLSKPIYILLLICANIM